jgi:hypothetical protein
MRAVRSCLTIVAFTAIFVGLTLMSALVIGAVRGQF